MRGNSVVHRRGISNMHLAAYYRGHGTADSGLVRRPGGGQLERLGRIGKLEIIQKRKCPGRFARNASKHISVRSPDSRPDQQFGSDVNDGPSNSWLFHTAEFNCQLGPSRYPPHFGGSLAGSPIRAASWTLGTITASDAFRVLDTVHFCSWDGWGSSSCF
ncbi:hypothetical protein VTI74DRAFT_6919 [Chaetomium olivicolor]